jgi:hypothetical protein
MICYSSIQADEIEKILCKKFMRFMMMRAENFIILRRKPIEVSRLHIPHLMLYGQPIMSHESSSINPLAIPSFQKWEQFILTIHVVENYRGLAVKFCKQITSMHVPNL